MKKYLFNLLILFFLSYSDLVTARTFYDKQTWYNITTTAYLMKNDPFLHGFKIWLEGQERIGDNSRRQTQAFVRTGLGYELTSDLSLWGGYQAQRTWYPLTSVPFNENRVWQQLLWVKSLPCETIVSRTRMEERFFTNGNKPAYRGRQMLRLFVPITPDKKFNLASWDEIFIHMNDYIVGGNTGKRGKGFDQNRAFLGIGYNLFGKSYLEVGYLNQYIKRFGSPNFCAHTMAAYLLLNF